MARTLFISPVLHAPLSYRSDPRQDDRNAFSFLRFIKPPGGSSLSSFTIFPIANARKPPSLPSDESWVPVPPIPPPERDEEEETSVSPSGSVPPGGDAFFIKIEKSGRNRRRVRARVRVATSLEAVWDVLTDYERLMDFIPGLAVCRLIERSGGFVRMFQC
ncbi:hypothetical protein EJ110_NYTH41521 [Nymphaea thermarum]|nr:hypothetical protein EJ110_NYTH41521 [Nymphaea thermarum]